uniref:phage tail sheath family protein n=1 Tax=Paenibacillus sp. CGMCC 1.16610 TaxID=2755557 RepID=UPI00215D659E|nr:phage tail sheath C-terminal domain-containing protein [Paenibacillus sp. CGMCC 1.16610]
MERHGIYTTEIPTSILSPAATNPTLVVIVGTAPVHLSTRATPPVNEPILCSSFQEAKDAFGYSEDFESYTLCEFMDAFYRLYGQSAAVFINVLDPATHKTVVAPADTAISSGVAVINVEGVLKSSVIVKSGDGATTHILGTDYTTGYDTAGHLVVTAKSGGAIAGNVATLKIGYTKLTSAAVDEADIIGGLDGVTGKAAGLELIQQIFPRFSLVPNLIIAPGFSHEPTVAAIMESKASLINGHFFAQAIVDLPTEDIDLYSEAPDWKEENHYTSKRQFPVYPKITYSKKTYHFSTHLAAVLCATDAKNRGVPFKSPSNQLLKADGAVQKGRADLFLGPDQAAFLNAKGIITALNFIGGWKVWGNRTGMYPSDTDPINTFIPIRRMFDWIANTVVLTYWSKVDDTTDQRLVQTVTDSINVWFNGLQSSGAILGGRVEFLKSENSSNDLMNGKLTFHIFVTPPSPAQEIDFLIEYDPQYLGSIS